MPTPSKQVERKYQLTKLEAGDYLLPGNDGKTLWRVRKIETLGAGSRGMYGTWAWGLWRYDVPVIRGETAIEVENWSRWDFDDEYDLRADAIQAALRSELPKPKPTKPKCSLDDAIRSMIAPDSSEGGRG